MKQFLINNKYFEKIIHDLKTPAIAQICALESLLKITELKFTNEEQDLMKLTLNSCNYLHNLIDTISVVLKLSSSKIVLNYEKFNINELITEILNEYSILLKYNGLKLKSILVYNIEIHADKTNIRKVIENIISFALKNAVKNSIISLVLTKDKNNMLFKITYTGIPIEKSWPNKIFNKAKYSNPLFSKTDIELGLYLSQEIINAHFGTIITANENKDNIFGFSIPLS